MQVLASMIRPGKTAPSVSVGVDSTKEALTAPTETDGAVFPGRIMLANTCTWTYRGDECGYHGPAVADEYDQPTSDITKDKCSKCLSGCKFRNNVGNFGGFLSINKLSQ